MKRPAKKSFIKSKALANLADVRGGQQKRTSLATRVYVEETSLILNLSLGWEAS